MTELEKRVERLENEKLELIKVYRNLHKAALWYSLPQSPFNPPACVIIQSLSAAHLLAASSSSTATPMPQQQHKRNTVSKLGLGPCTAYIYLLFVA